MSNLVVHIEMNGYSVPVGMIFGENFQVAQFGYFDNYLANPNAHPISISLPLQEEPFSTQKTRNFFDGLLPEGFMRTTISKSLHASEDDYLSVLALLGKECLGAIKVTNEGDEPSVSHYRQLAQAQIAELAEEGASRSTDLVVGSHLSLTGASGKVGLYYDEDESRWFQPFGEAPSTHIVKQSHLRFGKIVANEQLCLTCAKKLGIDATESFVVNQDAKGDTQLFATKRYDRKVGENARRIDGLAVPYRLHQEDFAQALGIAAFEKYEKEGQNYLAKMFELLRERSEFPLEDQLKLWDICVFNYLIGNADNHVKNFSLLYDEGLNTVRLAPAYDIVSTLIYENTSERMGLSVGGEFELSRISRESFEDEAKIVGLGTKIAMRRFDELSGSFEGALIESANMLEAQGISCAWEIAGSILGRGKRG